MVIWYILYKSKSGSFIHSVFAEILAKLTKKSEIFYKENHIMKRLEKNT